MFIYRDGDSFGDLALTEGKSRSATIKTRKICHLAVLDKINYQRILSSIMRKKRLELVEFLQSLSLFSQITKGSLVKFSYCFEEKTIKKDKLLFTEGETLENLYLIKEGEVIISKKVQVNVLDYEGTDKYKTQLNKRFSHRAEISLVGRGEFLGLYDIELNVYRTTAIVSSITAILLKININDFK